MLTICSMRLFEEAEVKRSLVPALIVFVSSWSRFLLFDFHWPEAVLAHAEWAVELLEAVREQLLEN